MFESMSFNYEWPDRVSFGLLALLGGFIFVFFIIGLILYVLMAMGLMKMAERRGIENPWLAWIPIANMYIIGRLVGGEITLFGNKISKLEMILPIGTLVIGIITAIPLIGWLIGICWFILSMAVLNNIYKQYNPSSATLYTVLSIILPFLIPIFIFTLRNK